MGAAAQQAQGALQRSPRCVCLQPMPARQHRTVEPDGFGKQSAAQSQRFCEAQPCGGTPADCSLSRVSPSAGPALWCPRPASAAAPPTRAPAPPAPPMFTLLQPPQAVRTAEPAALRPWGTCVLKDTDQGCTYKHLERDARCRWQVCLTRDKSWLAMPWLEAGSYDAQATPRASCQVAERPAPAAPQPQGRAAATHGDAASASVSACAAWLAPTLQRRQGCAAAAVWPSAPAGAAGAPASVRGASKEGACSCAVGLCKND